MCRTTLIVFSALFAVLLVTSTLADDDVIDTARAMEQLALKRSRLLALQQLLKELDNSYETIQKRTCLMNGGMSHSCDYSEMSRAGDKMRYLTSAISPGRRRRAAAGPSTRLSDLLQLLRSRS